MKESICRRVVLRVRVILFRVQIRASRNGERETKRWPRISDVVERSMVSEDPESPAEALKSTFHYYLRDPEDIARLHNVCSDRRLQHTLKRDVANTSREYLVFVSHTNQQGKT